MKIIQEMKLLEHYCINHPESFGSLSGSSGCTGQKKWLRKAWVLKNSSSDLFLRGTCCLYLGGVTVLETCSFFLLSIQIQESLILVLLPQGLCHHSQICL